MASWRFQGAKHHPNQNNSGSFRALSSVAAISLEQPQAVVKQARLVPPPAVLRAQEQPERMLRFAAVHWG